MFVGTFYYSRRPAGLLLLTERFLSWPAKPPGFSSVVCTARSEVSEEKRVGLRCESGCSEVRYARVKLDLDRVGGSWRGYINSPNFGCHRLKLGCYGE